MESSQKPPPKGFWLARSFKRAFLGLKVGLEERNFKRHLVSTIGALFCAFYYKLNSIEVVAIILCCGLILSLELMNTGIERLAREQKNPRQALDVGAASVLVASFFSLIIGVILIVPRAIYFPYVLIGTIVIIPLIWVVLD